MSCERVRGELGAFLDGELEEPVRAAVERHVGSCDACRSELESLRAADDMLGALRVPDGPAEGFEARVRERLRAAPASTGGGQVLRPRVGWGLRLAAAAAILVAATAVWIAVTDPGPGGPDKDLAQRERPGDRPGPGHERRAPDLIEEELPDDPQLDLRLDPLSDDAMAQVPAAGALPPLDAETEAAIIERLDLLENLELVENLDLLEALELLDDPVLQAAEEETG